VLCLRGALRWVLGVIPAAWCFIAADTAAALHLPALLAGPALAAMAVLVAMAGGAAQSARLDRA
jgi:hypothetical protein